MSTMLLVIIIIIDDISIIIILLWFQPAKSSFSYFDQPHSFSTFRQGRTADFTGHDYGNVVYSPLGSTTAETIMEEIEVPCKNVSQALGASAVRCMTGIACSLVTSPTPSTSAQQGDGDDKTFESAADNAVGGFGGGPYSAADDEHFDDVENKVQRLFDNMPDYTNVTISDQSPCKYTPLQIL